MGQCKHVNDSVIHVQESHHSDILYRLYQHYLTWFGLVLACSCGSQKCFFSPCPSVTLHSSSTKNNKIQDFLLTPATLFWGDSSSERAVMSHSPPPQTNPTQLERISLSGISKYWTIGQHNWKICLWKYHEGGNEKYRRWKWEIQVENHEKMKWGLGGWRSEN